MFFITTDHPQYFPGSEHPLLSFEVLEDMTILEVARAILNEVNDMDLDDGQAADVYGYVAWIMSDSDINCIHIEAPEYECEPDEVEEPWRAYYALVEQEHREYEPIEGVARHQWVRESEDIINEDELLTCSLSNWGAQHITNNMGVMVRPFTELGDMDTSYLIYWCS